MRGTSTKSVMSLAETEGEHLLDWHQIISSN